MSDAAIPAIYPGEEIILAPVFYGRASDVPWDAKRWPDFTAAEIACSHCGEVCFDEAALDALQKMRTILGSALRLNSAHRCEIHNKAVGGAPDSRHRRLAFDVARQSITPRDFHDAAIAAGFRGIGYGETYLHLDTRTVPARWHYSERAAQLWSGWLFGRRWG